MLLISHKLPNFFDIPDMMSVTEGDFCVVALKQRDIHGFARFGVAFVSQFTVAVNHMKAALLKFRCNRGFTSPGDTLDQIISSAHRRDCPTSCHAF